MGSEMCIRDSRRRVSLRVILHSSSTTCICSTQGIHPLRPSKRVIVRIEACGLCFETSPAGVSFCNKFGHQPGVCSCPVFPASGCLRDLQATVCCEHDIPFGEKYENAFIRLPLVPGSSVEAGVQLLIASAIQATRGQGGQGGQAHIDSVLSTLDRRLRPLDMQIHTDTPRDVAVDLETVFLLRNQACFATFQSGKRVLKSTGVFTSLGKNISDVEKRYSSFFKFRKPARGRGGGRGRGRGRE